MKNYSVKTKLFILVFCVLTPLFALHVVRLYHEYQQWIDQELAASEDVASGISQSFMNYLDKIWYAELAMGQILRVHPEETLEMAGAYLEEMEPDQKKTLFGYCWLGRDGIVRVSSIPALKGANLLEEEYIQRILRGEERVVGSVFCDSEFGYTMPVARPILQRGQLLGIMVGFIDVSKLGAILPVPRWSKGGAYGLVDTQGTMVYRSGDEEICEKKRIMALDSPSREALRTGQTVYTRGRISSFDQVHRLGVDYPIQPIGWVCFVTTSLEEVLADYRTIWVRHVVILLLILFGSLLAARALAEWILQPVTILKNAAQAISAGNLGFRTGIQGYDELAATGKAFDLMAERIEQLETNRKLFLTTSAHELRNPMSSIKGLVSLFIRRMEEGKSLETLKSMQEVLVKEVDRLALVLNQILEAFKTQQGKTLLASNFERINLIEVIRSAMAAFQLSEEIERINLIVNLDNVWIKGDFMRLEDALRNLLGNAKKYSAPDSPISVFVDMGESFVTVAIVDKGIGIPEDQLSRIFEGFERGNNLHGRDPGGMGLGLYICRDIVLRHGGEIWAQNNDSQGSTFFVRLPLDMGK